jgi:acyl-CoA thioesterase I
MFSRLYRSGRNGITPRVACVAGRAVDAPRLWFEVGPRAASAIIPRTTFLAAEESQRAGARTAPPYSDRTFANRSRELTTRADARLVTADACTSRLMMEASDGLYVALGDSTGVGVGASDGRGYVARLHERLRAERTGYRLLNLCTSGATSAHVVTVQLARMRSVRATVVTLFVGTNDLLHGVSPEHFGANIATVARSCEEHAIPLLLCTLPELSHAPAARFFLDTAGMRKQLLATRTLAYNARILACARQHGHAVHDLFDIALHDRAHYFSRDGFHPSSEGYAQLAQELWPAFQQVALRA